MATRAPARVTASEPARRPTPPPGARRRGFARVVPVARALAAAVAVGYAAMFVVVALLRLRYPYELEWMEGGTLAGVQRVLAGHSLYARPTLGYAPFLYTPLYSYAGAAVSSLTGAGVATLRAISIVSALAAALLVAAIVHRETADRWASVLAGGLLLACYRVSGAWLDVARVDSLFLALTLAAVLLARRATSPRAAVVAGLVAAAATMTKQQAAGIALAVGVGLLLTRRPLARPFLAAFVSATAAAASALEATSAGWFHVYAAELLLHHELAPREWLAFWTDDVWRPFAAAIVLAAATVAARRVPRGTLRFHGPVFVAALLVAWSSRLHTGGYDNVLLPLDAAVAVALGIAAASLGRSGRTRPAVALVALVLVVVQFGVLAYDPGAQVPTANDRARGAELLRELRTLPEPTAMFGHGWYLAAVGRPSSAPCAALTDVVRAHVTAGHRVTRDIETAVRTQRYAAIVTDSAPELSCMPRELGRWYRRARTLVAPWPQTGTRTRPLVVWLPRPHAG